jgi:2-polyprenyl-6-methoxyphenol hydroxylase-like FAD-dependent oxidoreductase
VVLHMIQGKEIFIVGAGPVGLAAAIELTRRGARPRIIDADSGPNPNSRALAINPRTLDLLGPSGATEKLLAAGIKINKLVIRRNENLLATLDLSIMRHRYNFILSLAQHETEVILDKLLADMGVKVERNLRLEKLELLDRPHLTLSNGEEVAADIVIGADGAHSVVRKALDITFSGETDEEQFGLADATVEDWPFDFHTVVVTVMDTHLAPFFPLAEGFGRFVTTRTDCLAHLPRDARIKSVAWETDFKISYRQADTYQKRSVFIAGDAAHIHSPVGGRGMNLGIEDACWLAWLIDEGREKEFTMLRHPVGADVLKFTHTFTRFVRARGPMQDLALRLGLPLLALLPPLQRRLLRMLSAQDTPAPLWL